MIYFIKKLKTVVHTASLVLFIVMPIGVIAQTSVSVSTKAGANIWRGIGSIFVPFSQTWSAIPNKIIASIASPIVLNDVISPSPASTPATSPISSLSASDYIFIKTGDWSVAVSVLQKDLIKNGFLKISVPTGYFGTATQAAVKAFQKAHNLPQTGSVDKVTFAAMNNK